jgi:uncharacterized protein YkwD
MSRKQRRGPIHVRHAAVLLASLLLASIAALGISAVQSPSAEAAGGGDVRKCGGGKIFLNAKEKETFAQHNNIRRDHNLPTFCVHPDLQRAARAHSTDMLFEDYFDHRSCNRPSNDYRRLNCDEEFFERIDRFGYTNYSTIGENIAWGSGTLGTPAKIMDAWMHSPGHRANILKWDYREIGIGVREGDNYDTDPDDPDPEDARRQGIDGVFMYTADFGTRFH